jgi:hypothetical protein
MLRVTIYVSVCMSTPLQRQQPPQTAAAHQQPAAEAAATAKAAALALGTAAEAANHVLVFVYAAHASAQYAIDLGACACASAAKAQQVRRPRRRRGARSLRNTLRYVIPCGTLVNYGYYRRAYDVQLGYRTTDTV